MKKVIEELGLCFLDEVECKQFSEKILELLSKGEERKKKTKESLKDFDEDSDD